MKHLAALVLLLATGCGGDDSIELNRSAVPAAKAHAVALYAPRCGASAGRCAEHALHPSFRWRVGGARVVEGCEPEWPEADVPSGDCVELLAGGAGCAPAVVGTGLTRQRTLRLVRVWLEPDGGGWRVVDDAWQTAGGADSGEKCR